ncbi:hypothetical protein E2P81_ATG01805 [Venturia nashicola]|nr:hypothetical protein E2P81_ATG01805 [Venturia nashicola]
MAKSLSFMKIRPEEFATYLDRYNDIVPDNLRELDEYRFVTVPNLLQKRRGEKGGAWLEREEVQKLVEWKLKHGTFRPSLAKLVASNSEELVRTMTKAAFNDTDQSTPDMVKQLAKNLKGIGPATAALLASCYDPDSIPFFSDELFRWIHWDGIHIDLHNKKTPLKKPGKGWSRQIGYTPKEWESMAVKCERLQHRMAAAHRPVNCLDIEKVAYVLGKEDVDLGDEKEDTTEEDEDGDNVDDEEEEHLQDAKGKPKREKKPSRSTSSVGTKRKADSIESTELTTKRTRGNKSS